MVACTMNTGNKVRKPATTDRDSFGTRGPGGLCRGRGRQEPWRQSLYSPRVPIVVGGACGRLCGACGRKHWSEPDADAGVGRTQALTVSTLRQSAANERRRIRCRAGDARHRNSRTLGARQCARACSSMVAATGSSASFPRRASRWRRSHRSVWTRKIAIRMEILLVKVHPVAAQPKTAIRY